MKALVYDGQPGNIRLTLDYQDPSPSDGEVRIRTKLVGICNTDLEILKGYADYRGVLGHEFVGTIDQAQDPSLVGQRIVGEINITCQECENCRAGRDSHCTNRTALGIRGRDGALAEYLCLPVRNLHIVPEGVPDEAAVFTEPIAAACQILEQVHVRPSDRVVILGDGKLGLLIAQVLALTGSNLTVIGRHEEKLGILTDRGIAVQTHTHGFARNTDLVVECSGRAEGFETACQLVRPAGTIVLKSTYHGLVQADLSSLVVDEIQLVGSRCGPFPVALRLLRQGLVDVAPLVEAIYPLDDAESALKHAGRRGALKVLVRT